MLLPELAKKLIDAPIISPRGLKTKEIRNCKFIVDEVYMSYECRKLSLDYLKAEARWYLSGDPFNTDILDHASIWGQIQQADGRFFSNYGVFWFGEQNGFKWVIDQLSSDSDTRQAIIPMLNKHHTTPGNKDVVCTTGINFHIRSGYLHMTVIMRSSDFILGYAYDLPMFDMLHNMVIAELNSRGHNVIKGEYEHMSMSLHVYEKHWDMLKEIASGKDHYTIDIPKVTDAQDLIKGKFKSNFGRWLNER